MDEVDMGPGLRECTAQQGRGVLHRPSQYAMTSVMVGGGRPQGHSRASDWSGDEVEKGSLKK